MIIYCKEKLTNSKETHEWIRKKQKQKYWLRFFFEKNIKQFLKNNIYKSTK